MRKKNLIVPMTVALHAKFKWKAQHQGLTMAEVARTLIEGYVGGQTTMPEPEPDIYDELYQRISEAIEDSTVRIDIPG
jgi:hypothetical protein